jgi:hypothetical protein
MPHVADGILHAYLDGALPALEEAGELPDGTSAADVERHLRTCDDCRARLDRERVIHEGARQVLEAAAPPPVDLPPFDELRERNALPRGHRSTWLPAAWAASVLLAVGAGWWGSEVWREGSAVRPATETVAASRDAAGGPAAEAAPVAEDQAPSSVASAAGASSTTAGTATTRPADAAERPAAAAARPDGTVRGGAPFVDVADAAAAVRAAPSEPSVAEDRLAVGEAAAEVRTLAPRPLGEGVRAERAAQAPLPRLEPTSARMRAAPGARDLAAAPPAPARESERGRNLAMQYESVPASFRSAVQRAREGRLAWVTPEHRAVAGGTAAPVLVVAGGGEPSVDVAEDPDGAPLVRVRQRVDGRAIELLIGSVSDDEAIEAARVGEARRDARLDPVEPALGRVGMAAAVVSSGVLPDGDHELIIRQPATNVFIAMRGNVSADALLLFASRLVAWR